MSTKLKLPRLSREQIKSFLDQHNVSFIEEGKNVAREHVNIKCPFCSDDPSEHMGIWPSDGHRPTLYGCLRNTDHGGGNILRLFSAVSGIPFHILKTQITDLVEVSGLDLDSRFTIAAMRKEEEYLYTELKLPPGFRRLDDEPPEQLVRYLQYKRGYALGWFSQMSDLGIGYTTEKHSEKTLDYSNRVIITNYMSGRLVGFTGRDFTGQDRLRYKSNPGFQPTAFLYDWLRVKPYNTILILEGSFDSLKINLLDTNIKATALYTSNIGNKNNDLWVQLYKLSERGRAVVILDDKAETNAMHIANRGGFGFMRFSSVKINDTVKDFDGMTFSEVKKTLENIDERS